MSNEQFSMLGDLTALGREIEKAIKEHVDHNQLTPAFALAFVYPPGSKDVHWVTNVKREDGKQLFYATYRKMNLQEN